MGLPPTLSDMPDYSNDPVRQRRSRIAHLNQLANRIGYALFGVAMFCFVLAFIIGFKGLLVTTVTASLIAGSVLLAPSIVIGYAVKAAERDDLENGR